jgi:hypothetical protein
MSGGYFNYKQHLIHDVAQELAEVIRGYEEYGFEDPETLEEFKTGYGLLLRAYIYAHRIDYLLSGDDGEETFHRRLQGDLEEIQDSRGEQKWQK